MPFSEFQHAQVTLAVEAFVEQRRPPPEVRGELDLRGEIIGQEVVLSTLRPTYRDPSKVSQRPFAKVRWIATQKIWQLYWQRADLKWHEYETPAPLRTIDDALAEIGRDPHGCFWT
jgi:hypothetical protein